MHSMPRAQMGEEADSLYIILQGNVSCEASFVELPAAQRAVDFPVNVSSSSGWCEPEQALPCPCPPHACPHSLMVCKLAELCSLQAWLCVADCSFNACFYIVS